MERADPIIQVAVDTGGTFTDLVARQASGALLQVKLPSTPDDPGRAVRAALAQLPAGGGSAPVCHGTTVATNALLERRLARVVLVTNAGFEGLLALRRQARPDLYALHPVVPPPVVARADTLGVIGRRGPGGEVREPLEDLEAWIRRAQPVLARAEVFAVCLLHAYADGADERAVGAALEAAFPQIPQSLSHEVAPVHREYERAATAAVNAALIPRMGGYLEGLAAALAPRALTVMGSAGGRLSAQQAARQPVHTVLSGPAGGVRGALGVGQRCGRTRLLAFDMGGTSTDVSVVVGGLTPEDDGQLAEHPLRVPLLPIETVGAGGGSIAARDAGGALQVGPRSAGALPGPACYGHGGHEPTVTDAHVVLGRLDALLGGAMALDGAAAAAAVGRLAGAMGASTEATAQAILEVAEAHMARACKRVSLARGVDPRRLSLVAFGGAGGLHACALADELGCPEVLFPAEPGVLSAAGILDAPVELARTRSVLAREGGPAFDSLGADWAALVAEARAGLPEADEITGFADCRYLGQSHPLPVPVASLRPEALDLEGLDPEGLDPGGLDPGALRAAFDGLHTARFGYGFGPERPLEVVALRVFARSRPAPAPPLPPVDPRAVMGPARVPVWSATLWVPAGWRAERLPTGDWRCARLRPRDADDPVALGLALEVHRQRLGAIAEEMGAALMRAAFSANIKERKDFSCAVFDAEGRMLVHAAHIPVHLGSTPLSVRAAIAAVPMGPETQVLLNDPFAGGTHLPDVTLVTPVFLAPEDPQPTFYVANRAHHADVGGISAGSLPAPRRSDGTARGLTIDDEGFRLPPTVLDEALRARFAAASRVPDDRRGDLRAQEAANRVGAAGLQRWAQRQGVGVLRGLNAALLDYAERRMRAVLQALPDGVWTAFDVLDDDGLSDAAIVLPVTLSVQGDRATVDLRAAPDQVPGPMNAVRAIAVSAVFYCLRCLAGASLPANEGLLRPITLLTRPGSILDAQPPAAVSAGNVETSQRLVDALLRVFAQAAPDRIPAAASGSMNNVLFGGQGPAGPFVHYETLGGGGGGGPAGPGADGIHVHMTNTANTPVESLEQAFPVEILRYDLAAERASAPGAQPGGAGVVRAYRFRVPAEVTVISERRRTRPFGLRAPDGPPGRNRLLRGGVAQVLPGKFSLQVEAGDVIEITTAGGGAWAPPEGRAG